VKYGDSLNCSTPHAHINLPYFISTDQQRDNTTSERILPNPTGITEAAIRALLYRGLNYSYDAQRFNESFPNPPRGYEDGDAYEEVDDGLNNDDASAQVEAEYRFAEEAALTLDIDPVLPDVEDPFLVDEDEAEADAVDDQMTEELFEQIKGKGYIYNSLNSLGWTADVHHDTILFQATWVGPNGCPDSKDCIVAGFPIPDNRFYLDIETIVSKRCIAGGQIYNPSNLLTDFSRLSKKDAAQIAIIPSIVSQILSPLNMSALDEWRPLMIKLLEILENIDAKFRRTIEIERLREKDPVRCELTFLLSFRSHQYIVPSFYWPTCAPHIRNVSPIPLNASFMIIYQSDKYHRIRLLHKETVGVLKKLASNQNVDMTTISASIKTSFMLLAERLPMMTMNSYYVGSLHAAIKPKLDMFGEWTCPMQHRIQLSPNEIRMTGLDWGVDPALHPTVMEFNANAPNVLKKIDCTRQALFVLKDKMHYPLVYVEHTQLLWHYLQKYSIDVPEEGGNIGFFQQPDWDILADLPIDIRKNLLSDLAGVLINSYDRNWLMLINNKKKKSPNPGRPYVYLENNIYEMEDRAPIIYQAWALALPAAITRFVSRDDRFPIRTIGMSVF
jgi:hypothetical protein